MQLISAATTWEAEDVLDRIRPAAIVLDILLRSEDTWAFLARLKEDVRTRNIPILVASTIEDRAKASHLGADAYLVKPVERAALVSKLKELTGVAAVPQVLIIDDNEMDRYLLKQHLRKLPVEVAEASNGPDGIRHALESPPALILLDLSMPGMSGFEVVEKLKSIPVLRSIPAVIITSRVLTDLERTILMARADSILSKEDLSEDTLAVVLRRALGIPHDEAAATRAGWH
jgi:CheY-like chemotaxis protein